VAELTLDLKANALDSLNEALRQYAAAQDGRSRHYKFAVLHFAHFLELLFKFHVSQAHPLLIYRNPFSKKVRSEQTIGLWEAIQFIRNEGKTVDEAFWNDLEWLKRLRNNIEHHRFTIDTKQLRRTFGRLVRATTTFNDEFTKLDITSSLEVECGKLYATLADQYSEDLTVARGDAKEEAQVDGDLVKCNYCGESDVAVERADGIGCFLCGETEPLRECVRCGSTYPDHDVTCLNDDPGREVFMCYGCDEHLFESDD